MRKVSVVVLLLAALALPLLSGCGGGTGGTPSTPEKSGIIIVDSPTMAQLQADLAANGKSLPEFLSSDPLYVAPDGSKAYMTILTLRYWTGAQSVARGRTQWYECNLTSLTYPTDVAVHVLGGDPDLYVFSPIRGYPNQANALKFIGYDVGTGEANVGSFYAQNWGGTGRYVAAVYGFGSGTSTYQIRFW